MYARKGTSLLIDALDVQVHWLHAASTSDPCPRHSFLSPRHMAAYNRVRVRERNPCVVIFIFNQTCRLAMVGFVAHPVFPTIYRDMQRPQDYRRVLTWTYFIVATYYFTVSRGQSGLCAH